MSMTLMMTLMTEPTLRRLILALSPLLFKSWPVSSGVWCLQDRWGRGWRRGVNKCAATLPRRAWHNLPTSVLQNCIVPLLTIVWHPLCMVLYSAYPVLCCSLSASRTLQALLLGPVGGGGGLSKPTQSWGLYPGYGLTRKTRCGPFVTRTVQHMLFKWGFILTLSLHEHSTDKSGYHATDGKGKVIKN